jgi:hypothetical protein
VNQYAITRIIGYGSRAITTTVEAPNIVDALAMDRVMRFCDAEVAAGKFVDDARENSREEKCQGPSDA